MENSSSGARIEGGFTHTCSCSHTHPTPTHTHSYSYSYMHTHTRRHSYPPTPMHTHTHTCRDDHNRRQCLSLLFAPFPCDNWKSGTTESRFSVIVLWEMQYNKDDYECLQWMILGFPRIATISPSALKEAFLGTTPQGSV